MEEAVRPFDSHLEQLNLTRTVTSVSATVSALDEVYSHVLFGRRAAARSQIERILSSLLEADTQERLDFRISPRSSERFFRIRTGSVGPDELAQSLDHVCFHVPLTAIERISQSRYSAAGLPCLYCANNLDTAWREVGRPSLTGTHDTTTEGGLNAAIYRNHLELRLLNFVLPASRDFELQLPNISERAFPSAHAMLEAARWSSVVTTMPILIAVHTEIDPGLKLRARFRPEYVVPEMIAELIIGAGVQSEQEPSILSRFDGIRYSSVQSGKLESGINFAFFPKFSGLTIDDAMLNPYCTHLSRIFLGDSKHVLSSGIASLLDIAQPGDDEHGLSVLEQHLRSA